MHVARNELQDLSAAIIEPERSGCGAEANALKVIQ
jgi:hypothetical protein